VSTIDLSPSDIVAYDHVIRLTRNRYRDGTPAQSDFDGFIDAWTESNAASAVAGIRYRELCRQVPEWTAMVAGTRHGGAGKAAAVGAVFCNRVSAARYRRPPVNRQGGCADEHATER
jgi:hypothetical protein